MYICRKFDRKKHFELYLWKVHKQMWHTRQCTGTSKPLILRTLRATELVIGTALEERVFYFWTGNESLLNTSGRTYD